MADSFKCATCGQDHDGLPTDRGYTLPDEVWNLPPDERAAKARWTEDLCEFADRHFFRGLLAVPFTERDGYFGWGVWVEVSSTVFARYLEIYERDGSAEPIVMGTLANDLPGYDPLIGVPVEVQFGPSTSRPTIKVPTSTTSQLASEQAAGIGNQRHHEILVAAGAIKPNPTFQRTASPPLN